MAEGTYDAIVIGAGHNGLVTAAYLARAGWRVLVLERSALVGGACVTEETWPGYKVSTAAYVSSLLRPEIVRDLRLESFGYEVLRRDPSSFTPFRDNRFLLFWEDEAKTRAEIAKFSPRDAERFASYERRLEEVAAALEPLLLVPAPNPKTRNPLALWRLARMALGLRSRAQDLVELFSMSVADYLDRWFESDALKVRLATDGVIGALAGPRTPGTAYVLFHHVMGRTDGRRGVWGYVRGGMGRLTAAIAEYARSKGAVLLTEAPVARVVVKGQRAVGVALADGREFFAKVVVSNADPKRTFLRLFDPLDLPEGLVREIESLRMRSGTVKINVAARGLPDFRAYPGAAAGPQHRGTIHLCESMDAIEVAYEEAKWGKPSTVPVVEMCIPSVVDPSVAPPGRHVISLFVQYAPYERADGRSWDAATEKEFAERVFAVIRDYAPNWDQIVEDYRVLSPKGLEDRFGLTGGNIFHGEMTPDQLGFLRPSARCSQYATPIKGFFLCGSGCHPGGGVMGAPGYLAAKRILGRN